jgi:protein-disulfide isomerase
MAALSRRTALAAVAFALAAAPALAGVPAEAVQGDMSLGNPKAKVQVVEYASASCPHCAHFDETVFPAFKAKYIDTGRVRYTLKEFLTPPAQVAAAGFLLARCGGKASYFPILHDVFKSQAEWSGDLMPVFVKVGQQHGLSEEQVKACLTDQAALDALNARVDAAAGQDKVQFTPTFDINGKRIETGVSLSDLDTAIAAAEKAATPKAPAKGRKGR